MFSVLGLMKVDMANFAVSSIRPHLMQQSVEYERKKFQELLEKQPSTFAPMVLSRGLCLLILVAVACCKRYCFQNKTKI